MGGGRLMQEARKAKEAADRKSLFEELSGQAQSSILRGRMPDKFRQFVEAATADGPVENVYVPAGPFVEYFQGLGVDPYALIDEMEGVSRDDLDAALAAARQRIAAALARHPQGRDLESVLLVLLRRHGGCGLHTIQVA